MKKENRQEILMKGLLQEYNEFCSNWCEICEDLPEGELAVIELFKIYLNLKNEDKN